MALGFNPTTRRAELLNTPEGKLFGGILFAYLR
ncbi:hypothetical protein FHT79_001533 [Rhizobium sp. BK212]|nr:hypothetical protein [Rhizobium sp. BK212]